MSAVSQAHNEEEAVRHCSQGGLLRKQGQLAAAVASYELAIAAKPDFALAHCLRGFTLVLLGRPDEALASFNTAMRLRPDYEAAHRLHADLVARMVAEHITRASTLLDEGRLADAVSSCDRALALRADMIGAHLHRGLALLLLGRREEALRSYREAIRLDPEYAPAYSDCALVLIELEQPQEAVALCERALAIDAGLLGAHLNRGMALKWMGQPREALASLQAALRVAPDCAEAHWNAALCHLQLGEFAAGWREHEWRKRMREPLGARQLPCREWLGDEPLEGKTLFIHAEQGLGDTLQFCRYATLARAAGAAVVISAPSTLCPLLTGLGAGIQVIANEAAPPPGLDFHCAMLSMPFAMQTRLDTIPDPGRYLCTDPERVRGWKDRLGTHGLKVGVRWQGRSGIRADIGRSLPLAALAPLADIPGIRLISLQKGAGLEQSAALSERVSLEHVLDDGEGPESWLDTAALLDCLDLVITSDTSVAHLAGALARPTWVALKFSPDWRWLLDRNDTPWYGSVRLFRQTRPGDWSSVFAEMRAALLAGAAADGRV